MGSGSQADRFGYFFLIQCFQTERSEQQDIYSLK